MYKQLSGAVSTAINNQNTGYFALSGFDSNFVSANSGNSVTLPAGIYTGNVYIHTGMPSVGTGTSTISIGPSVTGTNASYNGGFTGYGFNGYTTGAGIDLHWTDIYYLPSGGTLGMSVYNNLGYHTS